MIVAATLAGVATGLGALPFLARATVPRRAYDAILGVGAGLMLSAATLGLLAHALDGVRGAELDAPRLIAVLVGFAAGFALLSSTHRFVPHVHAGGHLEHLHHHDTGAVGEHVHDGLPGGSAQERFAPRRAEPDEPPRQRAMRKGLLVAGGMVLHRIPEGFAIGAAYVHGGGLGTFLASAIAAQNVCEGAVVSAPLRRGGMSGARMLALVTATGLVLPVAAIAGAFLTAHLERAMPFLLALGAGGLIYLVSNEVIPESHSHGNEGPATLGIAIGFLATMALEVLTGR